MRPKIDDVQLYTQAHSQLKKRAPLTQRLSNLSCVSAAEHDAADQLYKICWTKPWKHLPLQEQSIIK